MCLITVTKRFDFVGYKKTMIGYKIVLRDRNGTYCPYYYPGLFQFEIGKTYEDYNIGDVDTHKPGNRYKKGFHVFKYLKDARIDADGKVLDCVIIKVKGTNLQVMAEQKIVDYKGFGKVTTAPCFVCKKITIIKEVEDHKK